MGRGARHAPAGAIEASAGGSVLAGSDQDTAGTVLRWGKGITDMAAHWDNAHALPPHRTRNIMLSGARRHSMRQGATFVPAGVVEASRRGDAEASSTFH